MGSNTKQMDFYENSVLVYEGEECLIWPYARSDKGYGAIKLDGKRRTVSRLVCEATHGAPPSPRHEAAHSCGKGHLGCVTKNHLSWKTPKENWADRVIHGTDNKGIKNGKSKLTDWQALEILSLRGKVRQVQIAAKFGVSQATVSEIQNGLTWKFLQEGSSVHDR